MNIEEKIIETLCEQPKISSWIFNQTCVNLGQNNLSMSRYEETFEKCQHVIYNNSVLGVIRGNTTIVCKMNVWSLLIQTVFSRLVDTLLIVPFRRQNIFPISPTTFIFPFCRQLRIPLIDRNLIIKHMVD
jgi:hypothetical protein